MQNDGRGLVDVFGGNGILEKEHRSYENRPQQILMASAVSSAIEKNRHLIVEAGTGIGKTLAYLVPFIYWSKENKKRVIISTYTKTLQEQIANKDLPFLQKILPVDFKFSLCVGSENYLCLRRLSRYHQLGIFDDASALEKTIKWAKATETGLKLEIDFPVSSELWQSVCRASDLCLGKKCIYRKECFYSKAKALQYKSDVLVSNHHLFFANLASGGHVLPKYDAVVFDEAQNVEEVASDQLGIVISNTGLNYVLSRIYNPKKNSGLHRSLKFSPKEKKRFVDAVVSARDASDAFFSELLDKFGPEPKIKRIREKNIFENTLQSPLLHLADTIKKFRIKTDDDELSAELKSYVSFLTLLNGGLNAIIRQAHDDYVYWLEIARRWRAGVKVVLYAAPIDVSAVLREKVFEKTSPVILTSATLSADGKFSFIKERLGIDSADELIIGSPFDYKKQVVMYVPENMPDPRYEPDEFNRKSFEEIKNILEITGGRAFCLFTSYKMLDDVYVRLAALKKYEIFRQGEIPKWKMLDGFKSGKNAVLLGTDTFWQGVDVPGRALECVIITRLPFAVPDEPLTEAKMEYLEKNGKDPFKHYQIPRAIIMLKQGFGRLIRRTNDMGIVALLDARIRTRWYGRKFFKVLPECSTVSTVEGLKSGYEELTENLPPEIRRVC